MISPLVSSGERKKVEEFVFFFCQAESWPLMVGLGVFQL
jgi:hypothetical protein